MINIKLSEIVENRLLSYVNGQFLFTADTRFISGTAYGENGSRIKIENGMKLEIPREEMIKYIKSTLENMRTVYEIDEILTLNIFDQEIFNIKNWRGTVDRNIVSAITDLVKIQKIGLKYRTKEYPETVVELIKKNRREYNNVRFDGYLLQLLNEGILNFDVLEQSGFFKELTPDRIKQLMEEKLINYKQIVNLQIQGAVDRECAIEAMGGLDNVARLYKRAERNRNRRESKLFIELIGADNAISLYSDGVLSLSDISKLNINKDEINNLPEEIFIKVLKRGLPKEIEFSSEELIDGYISKLSGNSLIELAEAGIIEPERLIDLPEIEVDEEKHERKIKLEDIKRLYTTEFIAKKLMEENINTEFIQKWNEKIFNAFDEKQREEFSKKVVSICKKEMNKQQFERMMHLIIQNESLPMEFFKENSVSATEIEDMYYNEEISEEEIINYYNSDLIGNESIQMLFGIDYDIMIEQIKSGKLSIKALSTIPVEILSEKVIQKELELSDVFRVYSEFDKAINAEDLKYILDEYETDYYLRKELGDNVEEKVRIVDFINNDSDPKMIRELYLADVLSHSDILELKQKGILTEEQSKEISKIDRERLYRKIFEGKVVGARQDDKPERRPGTNDRKSQGELNTNSRERTILQKKKFFKSVGNCDFKPIEAHDSKEPFYGYTLIGYPEYGLVVLENLASSKNNATYIMTIEEFKSYIEDKDDDTITITKGKLALKDEIKRGQAIRERYHVKLWGKNVIDTMREMSDEARTGISADTHIDLTKMMVDEFDREDLEKLKPEDDRAKRIVAESNLVKSTVELEIRKRELREIKKQKEKNEIKTRKEGPNHGEE